MKYHSVSLFSGIGGNDLALACIATPALYCEIDASARKKILESAMRRGGLPVASIHADVRTILDAEAYKTAKQLSPLIVAGSWPCTGNSRMVRLGTISFCGIVLLSSRERPIDRRGGEREWRTSAPGW